MVDKTKYFIAVLRSISNFIVLQNDHLFNYILKKIENKAEKTNFTTVLRIFYFSLFGNECTLA